jgi:cellulose synthase/poly-beta-1,6-N-acetylglucosamine synthase-like glycosyltransferase
VNCSVIIRCLDEERHLPRLLDAIRGQTLQPAEIIVVDSGSRDATVEVARSRGARIEHIRPEEFSFGRALNFGARAARGEILVIASAHTYPVSDRWLEGLAAPFEAPDVALVYGGQQGDARSRFSEIQLFKQWFPGESCGNQGHPFCNNANAAIRRSIWQTMPYDERIPALEDIHWARRALDRGLRIVYRSDAAIVHVHEESIAKVCRRYHRESIGMQMISVDRMGLRQVLALAAIAVRGDMREARAAGVLRKELRSILGFRAAQYWGTYRGQRWRGTLTSDLRARMYYPKGYRASGAPESDARGETAPIP